VASEKTHEVDLWHQRLDHLGMQSLQGTISKMLFNGMSISEATGLPFCEGCVEGKIHKKPFKLVGEICSTERLQLVHNDMCDSMSTTMSTESISGRSILSSSSMVIPAAVPYIS